MSEIILSRRTFLLGLAGLVAAPAIVRFSSLMPVRVAPMTRVLTWRGVPLLLNGFHVVVPRDQILMKGYGVVGVLTSELVEQPKPLWPLARRISGD